jgi:hypothetical protein
MKAFSLGRVVSVALAFALATGCSEVTDENLTTYVETVVASPHLTVSSGKWQAFEFHVEPDMVRPSLLLDFEVTTGKDVEVFVFDEAGFAEWPRATSAVYFSERVGSASDRIHLSRNGIHYLVVSNSFSVVTDKALALKAVLEYSLPDVTEK